MSDVKIEYDDKKGRFIISSPPWDVERARSIPNRRWNKKNRVWYAPALRANAKYILEVYKRDADFSPEALLALANAVLPKQIDKKNAFPSWYNYKTKPFNHQKKAVEAIHPVNHSALFCEQGTGKSKIAIDSYTARAMQGNINAVLVVCPVCVRDNWMNEIDVHCPIEHSSMVLDTKKIKKVQEWMVDEKGFKWLMVGVESLAQGRAYEYAEKFMLMHTAGMPVDESSRIKNFKATRSERCVSLGLMSNYRMLMTGTPITQGIHDLYMQFEFLDSQIISIGDYYSFRNRYVIMGGFEDRQIVGYQNVEELMDYVKPFTFYAQKKDVLDLPEKLYTKRIIKMSSVQAKAYKELNGKGKETIINGTLIEIEHVLEKMLRLQQIVGGFYPTEFVDVITGKIKGDTKSLPGKNPKLEELLLVAEEIAGSAVIWARYRHEIKIIADALREKYGEDTVVEYHGGIDYDQRVQNVKDYESGKKRWFVGNQSAGGIGINLVYGNTMIYYSNTFSLEERLQSEDRSHRIGQKNDVLYIDLMMEDSIDFDIVEAIRLKCDMADYVKSKLAS